MILFRADGNSQIGSGHIMRCLSLADALRDMGQVVMFITADDCSQSIIQMRGYECVVLHTSYDHMEEELTILLPLLKSASPHCVLLDSYFVTRNYMTAIRKETPLIYIDDQNTFDYAADLVVNYALYADGLSYPQNKRYLLGPKYALLRKEFQNVPRIQTAEQVRDVLLSTGGADPEHAALACVRYLREHGNDSIIYHVVLGAMNQDAETIEGLANSRRNIVLHRQVADMRSLMLQCDVAVSAAGTTLFELCACGVPTVTYILADNQIMNARSFEKERLMLCAGDIRNCDGFPKYIFDYLMLLIRDWPLRQQMMGKMRTIIDGYGAVRLAEAIIKFNEISFS